MFPLFLNVLIISTSIYLSETRSMTEDDIYRNAPQIIESRGFKVTEHKVRTPDGYILGMFRIKNPYLRANMKQRPILLQHGITSKCEYYLLGAPGLLFANGTYREETGIATDCSLLNDNSIGITIPFVLSACGYDVWLGNYRGNSYSRHHVTFDPNEKGSQFWNFSIDSTAVDLSSMINYIRTLTSQDKISYLGHSLGTTGMFMLLSSRPEFNQIVEPYIALAPVTYSSYFITPLKFFLQLPIFDNPGNYPLLKRRLQSYQYMAPIFFGSNCFKGIFQPLCKRIFDNMFGYNPKQELSEYTTSRFKAFDDTSFKFWAHISQNYKSNRLEKYDYQSNNMAVYGQSNPPLYNLSKITTPNMILMSSVGDIVSAPKNTNRIRSELSVKPYADYVMPDPEWSHTDFLLARDAGKLVNWKILNWLKEFEENENSDGGDVDDDDDFE